MAASSKQLAKNAPEPGFIENVMSWPSRFSSYVDELKREMKLVTWPSRPQVRSTTLVVLVTVFFFGVFFGVVDYVLALGQTRLYGFFSN